VTLYRAADSATDRDFVVATWSSSYKSAHAAGIIASEDWPTVMHATLRKLLARPGTRTIVAYEPPDFLYGFIAGDTTGPVPVVWYVYVKGPYRSEPRVDQDGMPIAGPRTGPRHARGLFRALGVDPTRRFFYACSTPVVTEIGLARKIPYGKFVPATARYTNYQERYE
jgi:hypothetical protein